MINGQTKIALFGLDGLNSKQILRLQLLYAPLMDSLGLRLYQLLISLNGLAQELEYQTISLLLNCSLDELEYARLDCEKFLLIKVYQENGSHQIELIQPKHVYEFIDHALLGRLLTQELGAQYLKLVRSLIRENHAPEKLGKDISQMIHASHLQSFDQSEEKAYQMERDDFLSSPFDLNLFLANTSEVLFPKRLRTKENLEFIVNLAQTYNLSIERMGNLVGDALDIRGTNLDLRKLESLVSAQIIEITSTDPNPLNWSTNEFLQFKFEDVSIPLNILRNIDEIRKKYRWEDPVMNVLVNYAIENNRGNINIGYLEMLSSSMRLNKVRNQQDAINHFAFYKGRVTSQRKRRPVIKKEDYTLSRSKEVDVDKQVEELLKEVESWD